MERLKKRKLGATQPRRSQRLLITAKIAVRGEYADGTVFEEQTQTVTVSSHGAMILLNAPLQIGQNLFLRHIDARDEVAAAVVHVGGRQAGKTQLGIEFQVPSPRFWRVAFPPDDWSP
jgi:hypothetical protein